MQLNVSRCGIFLWFSHGGGVWRTQSICSCCNYFTVTNYHKRTYWAAGFL